MGVDVADFGRLHVCIFQRQANRPHDALAAGGRLRHVEGIATHTVTGKLGVDVSAARLGMFQRLQDDDARALADNEAVALLIEGT